MGTSIDRSSMNPNFYQRGDQIPGIRCDGNDLLQVKEVMKWSKQYAIEHGPLYLQFMTYRYHGHSMSDPGTTYRTRDEVQSHRKTTDPILKLGLMGTEHKLVTTEELDVILLIIQALDDECDELVQKQVDLALNDPEVNMDQLMTEVYTDNENRK